MSHTAESVFQMAFEEIYSSDASTWHLQFHGNADPTLACQVDVFLTHLLQFPKFLSGRACVRH